MGIRRLQHSPGHPCLSFTVLGYRLAAALCCSFEHCPLRAPLSSTPTRQRELVRLTPARSFGLSMTDLRPDLTLGLGRVALRQQLVRRTEVDWRPDTCSSWMGVVT